MAWITVDKRDFAGRDLAFHRVGHDWDACLMHCKRHGECQFVIHAPNWDGGICVLKKDIARDGPNGQNVYNSGVKAAVAIKRLVPDQVEWQWARGEASLPGQLLRVQTGDNPVRFEDSTLHNRNGKPNTFLCQLLCLQNDRCTHVVYNNNRCWLMNSKANGGHTTITQATNTMVNLAKWNDFDMP
jgi:hypothetical protein